jgi:hypothetical protein
VDGGEPFSIYRIKLNATETAVTAEVTEPLTVL